MYLSGGYVYRFRMGKSLHNNSGTFLHKIGEQGELDDQLHRPWGLCVQKQGNHQNLLVCNARNGRVDQFTMESRFTGKTIDTLKYPVEITTTPDGLILVSDMDAKKYICSQIELNKM